MSIEPNDFHKKSFIIELLCLKWRYRGGQLTLIAVEIIILVRWSIITAIYVLIGSIKK